MGRRVWFMSAWLAVVTGAAGGLPRPTAAQVPEDSAVHVVRPGDTLWDIAREYLRNPYLWPQIYEANRPRIEDPDWIFPRERLVIPGLLGDELGGDLDGAAPGEVIYGPRPTRTVFYRPLAEAGTALAPREMLGEAEPLVLPGDFYRAGMLVPDEQVRPLGWVVEKIAPSVVPIQIPPAIQLYDRVFVRLAAGGVAVGDRLHIVRADREVEPYGRVYSPTGLGTVEEIEGNIATVVIDEMYEQVAVGDQLLPLPRFELEAAGGGASVQGRIVAFEEPHALNAVEDIAFLDVGESAGVEEGDEFIAVIPPTPAVWGLRPEIVVARLRVVRATSATSAARVIGLEHAALEPGLPVRSATGMR